MIPILPCMSLKNLLYFIFTTLFLTISSCTIQKRSFNKGFHVEWKQSMRNNKQSIKTEYSVEKEDSVSLNTFLKDTLKESIPNEQTVTCVIETTHSSQNANSLSTAVDACGQSPPEIIPASIKVESTNPDDPDDQHFANSKKEKLNAPAIISFCLAMLGVILMLIGGTVFPELLIAGLLSSIGAFVTGIISIALQKRRPSYRLSGFGIAGFIVGLIFMVTSLAVIALLFLL